MAEPVNITVDRNVATINSGRNKGWEVNIKVTAEAYLAGWVTRASIVDALVLSAGYLSLQQRVKELEQQLHEAKNQ